MPIFVFLGIVNVLFILHARYWVSSFLTLLHRLLFLLSSFPWRHSLRYGSVSSRGIFSCLPRYSRIPSRTAVRLAPKLVHPPCPKTIATAVIHTYIYTFPYGYIVGCFFQSLSDQDFYFILIGRYLHAVLECCCRLYRCFYDIDYVRITSLNMSTWKEMLNIFTHEYTEKNNVYNSTNWCVMVWSFSRLWHSFVGK